MHLELCVRKEFTSMDRSVINSVNDVEGRSNSPPAGYNDSTANDDERKKKHRRGKKKARPKWKPYSKMTVDERKALEKWEDSRTALKVADIAARSRRPIAPFNTTQFLMKDRADRQEEPVRLPSSSLARSVSYDSSLSGDDAHFEPQDEEDLDAFLDADFNQVYTQMKMDKLQQMTKQDLIQEYLSLEETLQSMERTKEKMEDQMEQMEQEIKALCDENQKLRNSSSSNVNSGVENLTN